jgi:hypothetical protein
MTERSGAKRRSNVICLSTVQKRDRKTKKRAAVAGGSKFKQGGVKQSGQEPLNVQKMDNQSNDRESLTTR